VSVFPFPLEIPDGTNVVFGVLVVVALIANAEILNPRVTISELRRRPVPVQTIYVAYNSPVLIKLVQFVYAGKKLVLIPVQGIGRA